MGPAGAGEVLSKLVDAGMNGPRLNFFHGSREEHAGWSRLSDQLPSPAAILQDPAGPGVRLSEVPGGGMRLTDGEEFF